MNTLAFPSASQPARNREVEAFELLLAGPLSIVTEWNGLRGEPKLAWLFLWHVAGHHPGPACVSPKSVAEFLGTDERSGRRAIMRLNEVGLVVIVDRSGSRWNLFLQDPSRVVRGRTHFPDGQKELGFDEEDAAGQSTAVVAQQPPQHLPADVAGSMIRSDPPADVAQHPPSVWETPYTTSKTSMSTKSSKSNEVEGDLSALAAPKSSKSGAGGSGATSAALAQLQDEIRRRQASNVPNVTNAAAAMIESLVAKLGDRTDLAMSTKEVMSKIFMRVRDPRLRDTPVRRVASAVERGELPMRELDRILDELDATDARGEIKVARWSYFVGAAMRRFKDLTIPWPDQKAPS